MTVEEAKALQPMLKELQRAAAKNDFAQFFFYDLRLHRRIWELSRNRIAAQALERAVLPLFAFGLMRDHRAEELNLMQEVEKHQRVITALSKGNGKQAAEAIGRIAASFETHVRADAGKPARRETTKNKTRK